MYFSVHAKRDKGDFFHVVRLNDGYTVPQLVAALNKQGFGVLSMMPIPAVPEGAKQ